MSSRPHALIVFCREFMENHWRKSHLKITSQPFTQQGFEHKTKSAFILSVFIS